MPSAGPGRSNAEIAARPVPSEATAKTRVGWIPAKLELRDQTQTVVFAYETGVVRLSDSPPRLERERCRG